MGNERDSSVFIQKSRSALRWRIAKIIWFDIISVAAYLMFTCWIPLAFNGGIVAVVYFIISAALDLFIVYKLIKKQTAIYNSFSEQMYNMDSAEFNAICRQAEDSGFKFNTFYMLDDYLFIPSQMILLEYTDIEDIKTTYHITKIENIVPVYDGAEMLIICRGKKSYKLDMKKIHEFKRTYDDFLVQLNLRREKSFEYKKMQDMYN